MCHNYFHCSLANDLKIGSETNCSEHFTAMPYSLTWCTRERVYFDLKLSRRVSKTLQMTKRFGPYILLRHVQILVNVVNNPSVCVTSRTIASQSLPLFRLLFLYLNLPLMIKLGLLCLCVHAVGDLSNRLAN